MPEVTNTPQPIKPRRTIRESFNELFHSLRVWLHDLMDLQTGLDREGTVIAIKNGRQMRGANVWMLMCSIMIASLGLDLDSPAVLIGAMLISPLMSPILGIGLAVGINDKDALFYSLRHFGIAIVIALATSILYFYFTPLGQFTEQISARTAPTFLDGLVAVFGGLAGIISTTRKDKTNAIPGVAIATALMPPLCVTGFGIANGDVEVALNSFYLFFLNSFFIALTTFIIIRFLKFPYRAHVDKKESKQTQWIIMLFSLLIIIPSAFILRGVIKDVSEKQNVKKFVQAYFPKDCLSYRMFEPELAEVEKPGVITQMVDLFRSESANAEPRTLVLQLIGRVVPSDSFDIYEQILQDTYHLHHTQFRAIPDYSVELKNFDRSVQGRLSGQFNRILDSLSNTQSRQLAETNELKDRLAQLQSDSSTIAHLNQEVQLLFSDIEQVRFSKQQITAVDQPSGSIPLLIVKWKNQRRKPANYRENLYKLYTTKAQIDTLEILEYN